MPELTPSDLESLKKNLRSKGRLIPIVSAQAALENNEQTRQRDTKYLHPSEICKRDWCPRSSMYEILGYEKEVNKTYAFQTLNIFKTGHDIHDKWQGWLERSGVMKQTELPIFNEEYHIKGHADGLIEDAFGEAILEIKSVGMGTIRVEHPSLYEEYEKKRISSDELWKKIRQPFSTHLRQINLYMYATGVHNGIVLYEWKNNQSCKEFEIKYQPAHIESILATASLVKQCLNDGTIIDRPVWAEQTHKTCKQCPYKGICWRQSDAGNDTGEQPSDEEVFGEVLPSSETRGEVSRDSEATRRLVRR